MFSLQEKRLRGDLITLNNSLTGGYNQLRVGIFLQAEDRDKVRGYRLKRQWERFRLGIRKKFFTDGVMGHRNRFPSDVVETPSPEVFKESLDMTFGATVWFTGQCCSSRALWAGLADLSGLFPPNRSRHSGMDPKVTPRDSDSPARREQPRPPPPLPEGRRAAGPGGRRRRACGGAAPEAAWRARPGHGHTHADTHTGTGTAYHGGGTGWGTAAGTAPAAGPAACAPRRRWAGWGRAERGAEGVAVVVFSSAGEEAGLCSASPCPSLSHMGAMRRRI